MSEHTLLGCMGTPSPLSARRAGPLKPRGTRQPLPCTAKYLYRSDPFSSDAASGIPAFGSGMAAGGSAPSIPSGQSGASQPPGPSARSSESPPGDSRSATGGDADANARPRRKSGRRPRRSRGSSSADPDAPQSGSEERPGQGETKDSEEGRSRRSASRPRRRTRKREATDGAEAKERPAAGEQGDAPAVVDAAPSKASESKDADLGDGALKRSRRRGSRGGRRRRKSSETEAEARAQGQASEDPKDAEAGETSDASGAGGSKSRRYTSKRGRVEGAEERSKARVDDGDAADAKLVSRKRGSRGGRKRRKNLATAVEIESIPFEEDDLPQLLELPEDAVLLNGRGSERAKSKRTKRSKKSKSQRKPQDDDEDEEEEDEDDEGRTEPLKNRQILVNAGDPEETRVTVVEDGRIVELYMTVKKHTSYVSDIYRGRVVNIESAIGAAFVDFGQGKNGFLHASDILESYGDPDWDLEQLLNTPVDAEEAHDEDPEEDAEDARSEKGRASKASRGRTRERSTRRARTPIDKLVKKGQMVAVQITKDAIGDKGPTLTTYVSIPGRYLVLMPSLERTGVSRKIEDEKERRRLKRILTALKIPDGMGVIVRTAGIGKTKSELKRDLDYLLLAWDDFAARLKGGRNPTPLYQESEVAIRTMRDLFTTSTEVVIVDDEHVYERMVEFTERLMPEYVSRIKRHDGTRPLLQSHGVEQDFEKIFQRRVELPSGGSIVIDQTEALVAIDVNSGRTREAGAEFEDIALKTNLEAVAELSRQIRLRDLGGIIVLDYIDMMRAGSRRAVEKATRDAFKDDRARSKIGRISQFGLLELTRQRLGPGLTKLVYDNCAHCKGSGRRRNASSRAQSILRRLGASLTLKGFSSVEVRTHPEVIEYLKKELPHEIKRLEETNGRSLTLVSVPDQAEDSVLHYLRADGREVRPGGRRKR